MSKIKIERLKVLQGANVWAYMPVLEVRVNIGPYEELPSDKLTGFSARLIEAMPSLWSHHCSEGRPGGFLERLREGTYMGHILEHVILELQSLAGMETKYGKTRSTGRHAEYNIVVHYREPEAAKMCVRLALELVEVLAEDKPLDFDLSERIAEIRDVAAERMLGPSTQAIVDAAKKRGIPWFRLDDGALVQLGHGCHAKRIQASESSYTSSIAVDIAQNKSLTKTLLEKVGVPVPKGEVVESADDAWQVARELGGPVVVKPVDGNHGKAVSVNLTTEQQVRKAFELARSFSEKVLVEHYYEGNDFRLLVVNGKLVAASQRRPAQVVGDGLHTIQQLVEMLNSDPRRGAGHDSVLTRINLDAAAELTLGKQGYTVESVPPAGVSVLLRDNSNLSTGGTATDVTSSVHPDNAAIAVLAAKAVGLDIAGIDVICRSLQYPLTEQDGGIVEVNAAPGLRMHVYPSEGKSRPVGEAIVDMLFPKGAPSRVPLIAVTGTNGKTTVTRMIAHTYRTMNKFVGMTSTDGVYFNGVRRVKADASGPRSAESVLQHPLVEVAILETARGGILRSGLAWDQSDVSVVTNIAADHLGMEGVDTLEDLARVKRVIVESVSTRGYAVLNADDELVADMAQDCPGKVIFFGMERSSAVMSEHLAKGERAVYLSNGKIVLAKGIKETVLLDVRDVPATYGGLIPFQVQNAMTVAAACWGAGVPLDSIRLGLRTFQADDHNAPGRFNMFNVGAARVIVDYGHNPHALRAVQGAIQAMQPRRSIGVVTAPGDRRDADIRELAAIAAQTFDWIILREDDDTRGRERGEVARIMSETINHTCPSTPVCIVEDEIESVDQALGMARDGDLVVIFADQIDEVLERVKRAGKALDAVREEMARRVPTVPETPSAGRRGGDGNGNGRSDKPGNGNAGDISPHERIEAVAELAAQGVYAPYGTYVVPPAVLLHDGALTRMRRKGQSRALQRGRASGLDGYTPDGGELNPGNFH
ncbi:MAG: cyanophycin synthetase [Chloroflexota bacterium]|nr:cyanophycin synthetase [Chloroflexota bacterium]MDQ5868035.1 cyanophycin synthetase [Chloroflexota bacterium]